MKTKFILETSTLEDVLMKKYLDMKKQDSKACNVCKQTPCQCNKSDEKELAEGYFNHSIDDAFKMLDDLMRQERDLDIEPMLKRLSPELQKQLVQWAQTDGKAAVANDEYPEADWAARINKYLHGVAEGVTPTPGLQPDGKYYNKAGRLIGTWNGRTLAIDPGAKQYWIDEFGEEEAGDIAIKWQKQLEKVTAPSEDSVKYYANELEKSDLQANRPRQSRQQYYDLAVQMLSGQQGMAEGSKELPQWKKDWYAKQKPNSWPKHPQPYHNPNWIDELSPEERKKLIGGKGVTEDQDDECPVHGSHGFPNLQADESACTCDFDKLANPSWPDVESDQEMDEGNLNEIDRRGFLKGLGAAALGAAASSVAGKAQAEPVGKNLGDGFLLTTVRLTPNDESKAVFDTKTNTYYTLNLSSDGKQPIFRSLSQFIVVKDGNLDLAFDVGPETKKAMKKAGILNNINEQGVAEDSRAPQHYFDANNANKDSKVRRNAEVDQSQHKQDWGRDPLDDITHLVTHLAFKAGEKVKGMFKEQSKLDELGANNPPQATGTSPAPTANTAANTAATTSTLNPQEQKQLDDLLKKAGVVK